LSLPVAEEQFPRFRFLVEQAEVVHEHLKTKHAIAKARWLVEQEICPKRIRTAAIDYLAEQETAFNPDATLPDAVGAINFAVAQTDRSVCKLADGLRAGYDEAKEEVGKCLAMINPHHQMMNPPDMRMRDDDL
jgi:hypothetical protein